MVHEMFTERSVRLQPYLGHYKRDCPELKNQNHGNQAGSMEARGVAHAFGG
ncbi:hypothetical protein Tco_0575514, partial [Tanacetum coccineum]